jgi:UrcA family protein
MQRHLLSSAVGIAASLSAVPCLAAAPAQREVPETQIVTYADLDLNSTIGRTRLERRIHSAVDRVCREDSTASPSWSYLNWKCFHAALSDGLRQMQLAVARATNSQASASRPITLSRN